MSILVLQERAGCFAKFVFLVSCDCVWLFLAVPWVCLQFVIVVFLDHTHFLLLQDVVSDLGLYYLSMSLKKNARLIQVKYFCCICYSHQLYCFFIELDNDWVKSGFNHMNWLCPCHMWDRNLYD